MTSRIAWRVGVVAAASVLVLGLSAPAFAQRASALPRAQARQQLGLAEIQRLFDAYTVVQAQEALVLDDTQFGRFLPRLKALHDARRRAESERQRLTGELARMLAPGAALEEARVREQLKALDDLTVRGAADARAALDALDQVLDLRQQARFRVFEQQMERRKFELLLRARRGQDARVPGEDRF
jgi:hypothetical protein